MHSDVTEGGLVFDEALNLSKSGWFGTFNYTISNVLDSSDAETTRVLKSVSAVGPSCNQSMLRGINTASIAREVEEYSRFLNEQSSHFSDLFENRAKELCSDIRGDIEALAEAKNFEDKKAAGKRIYYKINNFLPIAKALADEKKEHIEID